MRVGTATAGNFVPGEEGGHRRNASLYRFDLHDDRGVVPLALVSAEPGVIQRGSDGSLTQPSIRLLLTFGTITGCGCMIVMPSSAVTDLKLCNALSSCVWTSCTTPILLLISDSSRSGAFCCRVVASEDAVSALIK